MKTWSQPFISQGYDSGKADGIKLGKTEIVKNMMAIHNNMSDEDICKLTGLDMKTIQEIRCQQEHH